VRQAIDASVSLALGCGAHLDAIATGYTNQLPQELLLQAGGPSLVIPYTFKGSFTTPRIGKTSGR